MHGARISRVEGEVEAIRNDLGGIKTEMSGLKAGMRGLGDVLQRIEQSVASAQQQWQDDKQASRINPIALATVLISIISILVGGAWLVSGDLARHDERSIYQQRLIDKLERQQEGGSNGVAATPHP